MIQGSIVLNRLLVSIVLQFKNKARTECKAEPLL